MSDPARSGPPESPAGRAAPWRVLTACAIWFAWSQACRSAVLAALPAIRADWSLSAPATTAVASVLFLAYVVGTWTSGFVPLGRRAVMQVAAALSAVTLLAAAAAPGPGVLMVAAAVQGVALGWYLARGVAALVDTFPKEQLGRAIGVHELGAVLGLSAGSLFLGAMLAVTTWRMGLLALAPFGLVAVAVGRWWIPDAPAPPRGGVAGASFHLDLRAVSLMGNAACAFALIVGFLSSLPLILNLGWGVAPAAAAAFTGIVRLGGPIGALSGGYLGDRWGRLRTAALSYGVGAAVVLAMPALGYGAAMGVAAFVLGAVASAVTACYYALAGESYAGPVRDKAIGLINGTGSLLGSGLFPLLLGYLLEAAPVGATFAAGGAVSVAGIASVLALGAWRRRQAAA